MLQHVAQLHVRLYGVRMCWRPVQRRRLWRDGSHSSVVALGMDRDIPCPSRHGHSDRGGCCQSPRGTGVHRLRGTSPIPSPGLPSPRVLSRHGADTH